MKQTKYRFLLPVVTLMVAVSLVGCAKEDPNPNNPDRTTIAPLASLGRGSVEAGSAHSPSAQTKAVASGDQELDLLFVRADQTSASTYGEYGAAAITATRAAGSGEKPLTFSPVQYYRADGLKTKLTGWYPAGTYEGTARTVSWTIDGQQDVMTTPMQQGSWESVMPAMNFYHRLVQLQFYPYAETQTAVDAWGKITKIEVLDQQNTVLYDLTNDASGAVSFSGDASYKFSAGIADGGASLSLSTTADKATNAKQMGNPVMIVPQSSSSYALKLRITTSNNKYKEVTLTQALPAGTPYRLYMKFTELDITIEAVVAQWDDVATSDDLGKVRIGDYLNGGVVFCIDDEHHYKVVSVEEFFKDAAGKDLKWGASTSYVIPDARSESDSRANATAIKMAFDAGVAGVPITQTTFIEAFPSSATCYNYQGKDGVDPKGSWYLPSKNDLQYLYCAVNGYSPTTWNEGVNRSIPPNAAARTRFNQFLKNAGGSVDITESWYDANTESASTTTKNWFVNFGDANALTAPKTPNGGRVRCIKNITPPPAVGDYYFTDGSFSSKVESGKTVNGVIYSDPTKFKVVSMTEWSTPWAASNSYVVNGAQSDTDGRANSNAIKAYYDTEYAAGRITTTFEPAFPAAYQCYNYTGNGGTDPKGTWYLPAKSELQHLWCAFNGKAPISWDTGHSSSAPADATAQAIFNAYLTTAGGVAITKDYFWSSSEYSISISDAWYVSFSGSSTGYGGKNGSTCVRCVRDL